MIIVGITGSIGCGKTYLGNILKSMGYSVYNPDHWTHDLYSKPAFLKLIEKEFPQTFKNGYFNKRVLRNLVFNNNNELKKLEKIVHPFLNKRLKQTIRQFATDGDIIFLDVALLLEFGWDKFCDYVVVADVDDQTQKQRVMKRDGISAEDFEKIVAVQMPKNKKKEYADFVINTAMPENILKVQLIKFIKEIL